MIIVIGGVKGGSGKTTIATNLAVTRSEFGFDVLLVDADEQKSSSTWARQRDALGIKTNFPTFELSGATLRDQILRLKQKCDDIIIDVGGRDTTSQRSALSVADIYIIPFKPRSFDVWTIGDVKTIIREMKPANEKLQAFAFINQADPKGTDNEDALNILEECEEFQCLKFTIGNRKTFSNCASEGLGVTEGKTLDKKAISEFMKLYDHIFRK